MSLSPSSHFCYLSPPALYLSILPTHNLFHYVSPFPSRSNSPSPSHPFLLSLSSFHFLSVPLTLIPPLGVWMRFSLAASRSVFQLQPRTTPRRCNNCGGDPAARSTVQMHMQVRVLPPLSAGVTWGHCVVLAALLECVCLFVYRHLSSAVTPPGPPLRSRSGPLWQ